MTISVVELVATLRIHTRTAMELTRLAAYDHERIQHGIYEYILRLHQRLH